MSIVYFVMFNGIIILTLFVCKVLFNTLALQLLTHHKGYEGIMLAVKRALLFKAK